MKSKPTNKPSFLSILVLIAMLAAALLDSSLVFAQDGAPEITPTPTLEATLTSTPTQENVSAQADEPTGIPEDTPIPTDTPEAVPTDTTESNATESFPTSTPEGDSAEILTQTPEGVAAEALTETPTATAEAEVVPLIMPEDTSNIIPGQYIVVYKKSKGDAVTLKAGRDMVKKKGGQLKASYSAALKGFAAKLDKEALHELRTDPDIAYIEPDQYIHAVDDIVIPMTTQDLSDFGDGLWGLDRIDQLDNDLDGYYHYPSSAGSGVSVYILDSGILTSHTQFEGRASNDYDLINDGRNESQYYYHGTAVASVVGGKDYGVAKGVTLHSVRVLNYQGVGSFSNVIAGLNWVIANHSGSAVVNMSLGDDSVSSSLNSAVANTVAAGIPVVVASGNFKSSESQDACDWSPASAPSAITVGATTSSDSRDTSYSTYGSCLDLFAPGTSILAATNTGDSDAVYASGTSLAAPMVAGAAALYLADNPTATPAEVTAAILEYATSDALDNVGTNSPNLLLAVFSNEVAQVTLSSPADVAETNQTALTLTWNAGYIGNTYELQVDDSSSFDSLFYTTTTESLSASVSGLSAGTWYWRVRAANTYGTTGEWSATRSFIVDLTPPSAPALTSPADGTKNVGTPAFAWGSVATAAYYQFEYGTSSSDPDGTHTYQSGQLTTTSTTPPSMTREVQYYWFARARDAAGNWSAWSSPFAIMIVPAGPSAPSLTSPTNGAAINDDTPSFSWSANSDPLVTYNIQISASSTFDPLTKEADGLTSAAYTSAHLDDGKYYWRVRGQSKYGIYGGWSAVRYFNLDTVRPAAPALVNPISGTVVNEIPVFSWTTSTDWKAYQFAYSLSDNLVGTDSEDYIYVSDVLTTNSITPAIKNTNVTYFWNVRARDAAGNWSYWSSSRYLTIQAGVPGQATLDTPVSGYLTNDPTPTLSWKLLKDSAYYQLQIATSTAFSTLLVDEDGLTGTSYTVDVADALASGTYYWRVRGRNNTSDYGLWSGARYFKVDVDAPIVPNLTYPASGASVVGTPTFKWSQPSGAKYYQLRYADSDAPDTYLYTSAEITKYYLKPPAMDSMNTYAWSVRAGDAAGNWSAWSAPFSVTILPPVPGKPVQTSPANGAMINPELTSLELTWQAAANADTYHIQVSTSTSFVAPYLVKEETDWPDLSYDPGLSNEGTYYWRVQAENANNVYGSWTSARYFRIDNTKPAAPALYYPKTGTQVTGTPAFQWLRAGDAATFEFQYNTSNSTDTYVYKSGVVSGTSIRPPTMATGSLYYWFVRAYDKAGNVSPWSAAYTVTILPPKPSLPTLNLPINGKVVNDLQPEFSWSAVNYAETYDFQASTNSSFTAIVASSSDQAGLTFTPTTDLPQGRVYWRVRAKNTAGTGSWSTIRYIMVDTLAPAAPVLRSPADNASVTGWPTLSWYAVSGARYYQLAYNAVDDPDTALYTSDWTTATSLKVTGMDLNTTLYWFVRSKDTAGNISEDWSASRRVIVRPATPVGVTLTSPVNGYATDDATLDLAWNAVTYGNTYEIEVDTSTYFNSSNKHSYTSDVETLSYTTAALDTGKWYWRVKACNVNDDCGSWSTVRSIVLYPYFDTQFSTDGNTEGWEDTAGATWTTASGALTTAGLTGGKSSSASYSDQTFTDFTYEALMKMDAPASDEANSFGLVLRGSPSFDAWNDWARGVYFVVRQVNDSTSGTQYACALAYRIVAGAWGYLGGSCGEAVYGDWNSLKVYAKGTTWKFYVNDYLILSTSVSSITSGRLGVVSWGQNAADTFVDEASTGMPVVPTALSMSLSSQSASAANVDPEQVFEEMKK